MARRLLLSLVVVAFAASFAFAAGTVALEKPGAKEKEKEKISIKAAGDAVGKSMARVFYYLQYSEGEQPYGGSDSGGCQYIRDLIPSVGIGVGALDEKRPAESWGFFVDKDVVLTEDPMIEDRFIEHIEVESGGKRYKATVDRMALANKGIFLKLEAPAEGAQVLSFDAALPGPYAIVNQMRDDVADWALYVTPLDEDGELDAAGHVVTEPGPLSGIVINKDAKVVGAVMSSRFVNAAGAAPQWKGSPAAWPAMSAKDYAGKVAAVEAAAKSGIVQVTIHFRSQQSGRWNSEEEEDSNQETEVQAAGGVYAPGKVVVPTSLSRRDVARIESMEMVVAAAPVPLTLVGGLREYGALVAEYAAPVEGVTPIPFVESDEIPAPDSLLVADKLSFEMLAREEHFAHGRLSGAHIGYNGLVWPEACLEDKDTILFTLDGRLLAVPFIARQPLAMQDRYSYRNEGNPFLMPAARLAAVLSAPDSVDASYKPLSEEDSKRLVWLGIETQKISKELAREKNVSLVTKGGETGALVTHVYDGSPAAAAGIKRGDIFVRFYIPDQVQPVDVKASESQSMDIPWSQIDEVPVEYMERMPRPWPSQKNALTRLLTEVGPGKTIRAEFSIAGKTVAIPFKLEIGPADFEAAASFDNKKVSGLTVKDLTYEVRYYMHMKPADPGVVVSLVEPGTKAAVAGVKPCEIITAVNNSPVMNVEEFKAGLASGGDVTLTVRRMSQSRVVKIQLPAAESTASALSAGSTASEVKPAVESTASQMESTAATVK